MGLLGSLGTAVGTFTGMPWMGAVGSGLDSLIDRNRQQGDTEKTNEWNAQQAQLNRDFQERMRATQYQTTVKDLQAAGLNPMLAYTNGGAGTPSGAISAPAQSKVATGMSSAYQSAQTTQALQTAALNQAQIDQVIATTQKIKSETLDQSVATAQQLQNLANSREQTVNLSRHGELTFQQALTQAAERGRIEAATGNTRAETQLKELQLGRELDTFSADTARRKAESALTQMEVPKAKAEADFFSNELGKANPALKQILMLLQALNSASSLGRSLR